MDYNFPRTLNNKSYPQIQQGTKHPKTSWPLITKNITLPFLKLLENCTVQLKSLGRKEHLFI